MNDDGISKETVVKNVSGDCNLKWKCGNSYKKIRYGFKDVS